MIDLDGLEPEFRTKLIAVIRECLAAGMQIEPEIGIISVQEQAKSWRRSSTDNEIDQAIFKFTSEGCQYLAGVLTKANSPVGSPITDKLPGYAWHNYGEEVEFNIPANKDSLAMLKKAAKKQDLTVDISFSGNISVRKSPFACPKEVYTAQEIDKIMHEKWGS
jgi:hypothetical protein